VDPIKYSATDAQDDDDVPGPLEKIRASICEIAELYALKYSEEFKQLGSFVNGVWTMLTTVGPSGKEDLVSRHIHLVKHKLIVSWSHEH
jgi:exportin-2 (importin alpha re-exporter)